MRKIGALCERVAFYKPRAIRHLMLTNVQTQQRADVDATHWRTVVASLFLSERQVRCRQSAAGGSLGKRRLRRGPRGGGGRQAMATRG
jgi:hypothetical protein